MRRFRWPWILAGFLGTLPVFLVLLYPSLAANFIRSHVLPQIEAKLARVVEVGDIDVDRRGHIVLRDIYVRSTNSNTSTPVATVRQVEVEYSIWSAIFATPKADRVRLRGMHLELTRDAQGIDNYSDFLHSRNASLASSDSNNNRTKKIDTVVFVDSSLRWNDTSRNLSATVQQISGQATWGAEMSITLQNVSLSTSLFGPITMQQVDVTADFQNFLSTATANIVSANIPFWKGMSLTNIHGSIHGNGPAKLQIDVRGSYGGVSTPLWSAKGWFDPKDHVASVQVTANSFSFDKLQPILKKSAIVDFDKTSVDADVRIDVRGTRSQVAGTLQISGLNLYHPKLAEETIRDFSLEAKDIRVSYDSKLKEIALETATLASRGIEASITGTIRLPGNTDASGTPRTAKQLVARVLIPKSTCQSVLEAIPVALAPHLQGFELEGNFESSAHIEVDWADLDNTVLEGTVGIQGCRVRKAPAEGNATRLSGSFIHHAIGADGKTLPITIGPENPDFIPLWDVSPYLIGSLMTTEDSRFFHHHGFIVREFRTALIKNLKAGRFKYGASSITMQLVKNVLLSREKTLARKLQELVLTWYVEKILSKNRILEIYVNAIEYGPNLYGIGAAARRYFGKHPRDLNPVEAAFFSSILPAPKRRYRQYCNGKLWDWSERKIQRILETMHKRERLSEGEYFLARDTPLIFDPSRVGC